VRESWRELRSPRATTRSAEQDAASSGDRHLALAKASLRELVDDPRVPEPVREALAEDYAQVQRMLEKLEHGHIHIAAVGRVSVGKSSVLNALIGEQRFQVSPLHGSTTQSEMSGWNEWQSGGVFFIDTPGLNEVAGEAREALAHQVASRADLVLFVADGDITDSELHALRIFSAGRAPVLFVLNKADRYSDEELAQLCEAIARRSGGLVPEQDIVSVAAAPSPQAVIRVDERGRETETRRERPVRVEALRERLWQILEAEGKSLAALNAGLFAGELSDQVARRILAVRKQLGERVIRTYCVAKGVAVALNPVPVADLFAAALMDVSMVVHLSKVYNLPVTRREAGTIIGVIATQLAAVMGTVWAIHLASSALKVGTGGLSVAVTAGAQGAVAYYSSYVVGRAAERYLAGGKSWGDGGAKAAVQEILDSVDRDTLIARAREDIRAHLQGGGDESRESLQ